LCFAAYNHGVKEHKVPPAYEHADESACSFTAFGMTRRDAKESLKKRPEISPHTKTAPNRKDSTRLSQAVDPAPDHGDLGDHARSLRSPWFLDFRPIFA
jgi:hypothetical protein